ncbi:hypothetical protein [Undibacterium sp. RuTC16W]|uniref:hypothetical protein n=1 Tax=Undibacterium sp. RuTC16W TaxID=3413048 RepID=UPI003BF08C8C
MAKAKDRKMSISQQEEIQSFGEKLCLERALYVIHKEGVDKSATFIDQQKRIYFKFCSGKTTSSCESDNLNLKDLENRFKNDVAAIEVQDKVIKRYAREYETLKSSAARQNLSASAELKRKSSKSVDKVKQDIIDAMKDPESVKFKNLSVSSDGSMVCGEVNAKNSMGGYDGFKKFVNIPDELGHDFTFYEGHDPIDIEGACYKQSRKR